MQKSTASNFLREYPHCQHVFLNGKLWIAGRDVAQVLLYKDPKQAIQDQVPKEHKLPFRALTAAGAQPVQKYPIPKHQLYLSDEGIKHLICKSKQSKALHCLNLCGLEHLKRFKVPTVEQEIMAAIMKAFADKEICMQKDVPRPDGRYRVDLFFVKERVMVECDENNHVRYDVVKEVERENYCIKSLIVEKLIRFNPDSADFCIFDLIHTIRKAIDGSDDSPCLKKRKL